MAPSIRLWCGPMSVPRSFSKVPGPNRWKSLTSDINSDVFATSHAILGAAGWAPLTYTIICMQYHPLLELGGAAVTTLVHVMLTLYYIDAEAGGVQHDVADGE